MQKFDFLVIGSGIAGLTFACEVARHGRVAVIAKKSLQESATAWAQGGIAAVSAADDTYDLHIEDTLKAGAGLCNKAVVELVVREGPARIADLIQRGVRFDREADSSYHLHREGGHSTRRIYHFHDHTGQEIQRALLATASQEPNIKFFENCSAIDLITTAKLKGAEETNQVLGAYVLLPDGQVEVFQAQQVLIATGGAGKVYLYTSNPDVASGDGLAMCYRAGCSVANLEFFQFHPTCLHDARAKSFLISEAIRGEGGILSRFNGERFMSKYHVDQELAPRDVVARAIDHEMKVHGEDAVLLDISHKGPAFVREHFPKIYEHCLKFGYDLSNGPIPVVPAAHYCCGGVVCDLDGGTAVRNLYVAGEVAHTGLHGANRLASNSLLEGVVFGYRAAQKALASKPAESSDWKIPDWDSGQAVPNDEGVVITQNWDEIRRCMWNYVGIVRSTRRLERALRRIQLIKQEINDYYWNYTLTSDLLELRNLCLVSELIIQCALKRKESRGLHCSLDYPDLLPGAKDSVIEAE